MPPTPTRKRPSGHLLQVLPANSGFPIHRMPCRIGVVLDHAFVSPVSPRGAPGQTWHSASRSAPLQSSLVAVSTLASSFVDAAAPIPPESTRPAIHAPI